jgi:hypothetical protein
MTTRPILFSAPMVRALLADTKTQTRRIVKYIPALGEPGDWCHRYLSHGLRDIIGDCAAYCPYGRPGDRLWVRETFLDTRAMTGGLDDGPRMVPAYYRADDMHPYDAERMAKYGKKWTPSIHMPRWASRITLEITGVRVERLQEISEVDARAEGVDLLRVDGHEMWRDYSVADEDNEGHGYCYTAVESYITLWESINGPGSWDANPWVWVINFKRIQP